MLHLMVILSYMYWYAFILVLNLDAPNILDKQSFKNMYIYIFEHQESLLLQHLEGSVFDHEFHVV